MKSVKYILLSYVQRDFFTTMGFVVGVIIFVWGNILTLTLPWAGKAFKGQPYWDAFFVALAFILCGTAFHLKELVKDQACFLYPNYARNQLMAVGVILLIFLFWPVFLTGIFGFPVLTSLGIFLPAAALILWMFTLVGKRPVIMMFTAAFVLFFLRLIDEMSGIREESRILELWPGFAELVGNPALQTGIILFSILLLFLFALYFLKFSRRHGIYRGEHDSPLTRKILRMQLLLFIKTCGTKRKSMLRTSRLIQSALFEPNQVFISRSFFTILIIFTAWTVLNTTLSFVFSPGRGDAGDTDAVAVITTLILLLFCIGVLVLSVSFLRHRGRLAMIWTQGRLDSRREFAWAIILAYLMVSAKLYFLLALAGTFFALNIPSLSFTNLIPVLAVGFILFIFYPAATLLLSKEFTSRSSRGWALANAPVLGVMLIIFFNTGFPAYDSSAARVVFFVLFSGSLLLLRWAFLKWSNAELDFFRGAAHPPYKPLRGRTACEGDGVPSL